MKKIDPRLFQELRRNASSIVMAWKLTRDDGYRLGFTSGDTSFIYDGLQYDPTNAFSGTAATSKNNLSVDNMSAVALTSDAISEKDLKSGRYDNAEVRVFWINPYRPEWGIVPIKGGRFGEVVIRNGQFEVELRAAMQKLQQTFGEFFTLECSAQLGDDKCKVNLYAETWKPNTRYIGKAGADAGIGSFVKPSVENGYWYVAVRAGAPTNPFPTIDPLAWNGPLARWGMALIPDMHFNSPAFLAMTAAQGIAADREFKSSVAEKRPPDFTRIPTVQEYLMTSFFRGYQLQSRASVTVEGYTTPSETFYEVDSEYSGSPMSSQMYLKPTKQYAAPLSAMPGAQPMTITNGSVRITYAIGLSGGSEPAWPVGVGAEVQDNTIRWRAVDARVRTDGWVSAVYSRGKFADRKPQRGEPSGHYKYGKLTWLTGLNEGLSVEIRDHVANQGEGHVFHLLEVMPFDIREGDTFKMTMGCGKTRGACKRFDNINNFRGFPDMPTEDKALATPNFTSQGTQQKPDKGGS